MSRRTLPLTGLIRESGRTVSAISVIVTITFTMLILSPTALAVRQEMQQPEGYMPQTADAKFTAAMEELTDRLKHWREALKPNGYAPQRDAQRGRGTLAEMRQRLSDLDPQVRSGFDDLRQQFVARDAAPVMLERQQAMETKYNERYAEFQRLLDDLQAAVGNRANETEALDATIAFLDRYPSGRPQRPFDPDNLPFMNLQPMPDHTPMMTRDAYREAGLLPAELADKRGSSDPAAPTAASHRGTGATDPDFDNPDYLAETDGVVITEAIEAQAAELNHDPVEIFHWVRNNVGWLPTWGAQQDSDITLGSERGNAFDIASLLIALLRASDIPARYAHGTIQVDADTYRNWSSGFDDIESAIALASSGGIPIIGVTQGGQIGKVQMEHVWVEVALDYEPSRGAHHIEPDNWVPMDPSFKQYEYLEGLNPLDISDVDPDQLAQDFVDSGTVNEEESWVSGFDPQILADAQEQIQTDLEAYIEDNINDPTVGDVIGGRKVIIEEYPTVPSALPYTMVVEGANYASVPTDLQQAITLAFGISHSGFPIDPITIPWPRVNNHKLTLSFAPATEADEQALTDLIPEDADEPEDLPSSIPSTIEVRPELKLNGDTIHSGSARALGEELTLFNQVYLPGRGHATRPLSVIVGSYLAIGSESGSLSSQYLTELKQKVEETRDTLETEDPDLIETLNREDLLGDLFHAGMLGYYAQYTAMSSLIGLQQDGYTQLNAGMGLHGYEPRVDSFFGFPRGIKPGGVTFDLPIASTSITDGLQPEAQRRHARQIGTLSSALEHATPEQMFSTEDQPADAISSVKALSKASAQGQRIYELTPDNMAETLPNLSLYPETEAEIEQALNAGLRVTAHADHVAVPGWEGAGYIITNPETGAGAYKISGGANGGYVLGLLTSSLIMMTIALAAAVTAGGAALILAAVLAEVGLFTALVQTLYRIESLDGPCFLAGLLTPVAAFAVGLGFIGGTAAVEFVFAIAGALGFTLEFTPLPGPNECLS